MHGYAARATGALILAIAIGVAVYIVVTFAVAYAHHPKRGLPSTFGYAFRESVLAFFVTALFPLYVATGHKRGRGDKPVVLVHGYTQNRADFVYISHFLRKRGLGPIYGFNYFSFADIRTSGQRLARFVERVCKETGAPAVDLVCHSMGGLVARHFIRLEPSRVRRCVTIASPHSGVHFRGPVLGRGARQLKAGTKFIMEMSGAPLGVPMLSIYSTHDNIVAPHPSASLAAWGGRDFVVDHVGHLTILFDKRVAGAVADFLLDQGSGQSDVSARPTGTIGAPPEADRA